MVLQASVSLTALSRSRSLVITRMQAAALLLLIAGTLTPLIPTTARHPVGITAVAAWDPWFYPMARGQAHTSVSSSGIVNTSALESSATAVIRGNRGTGSTGVSTTMGSEQQPEQVAPAAVAASSASSASTSASSSSAAASAAADVSDAAATSSGIQVGSLPGSAESAFDMWAAQHGLSFAAAERAVRLPIFARNMAFIEAHNRDRDVRTSDSKGTRTYTLGPNEFSHLTDEEFGDLMGTRRNHPGSYNGRGRQARVIVSSNSSSSPSTPAVGATAIPASVDWRANGKVTPVRKQGKQCAASYAFTAAATIESLYAIKKKKLLTLSPQEFIDCGEHTLGCSCDIGDAYQYALNYGVTAESKYPYKGKQQTCKTTKSMGHVFLSTVIRSSYLSEGELKMLVAQQPVAIEVDTTAPQFRSYKQGIYNGPCHDLPVYGPTSYMTIVGYGTSNKQAYWILKNSWGTSWGEKGYMRLKRHSNQDVLPMCTVGLNVYVVRM